MLRATAARAAVVRVTVAIAVVAGVMTLAPHADAAMGPGGPYAQAQVGLTYTVYVPTRTFTLKRTSFALDPCGGGLDDFITAEYGKQASGKGYIGLNEFEKPCIDGPDGVGRVTTILVKGAKATVMGACAGGASTCASATRGSVLKNGYTTVTLPAAPGLKSTFVEVYTSGLTVAQIRTFLRTLRTVQ